jgi:hypothetical protein
LETLIRSYQDILETDAVKKFAIAWALCEDEAS